MKQMLIEVQEEKGTGHAAFRAHNMLQRCVQEKMDFTVSYTVQHEDIPTEQSIAYTQRDLGEKFGFGASVCKILNN